MIGRVKSQIAQVLYLARFSPFDVSTAAGRADERHRRALLASFSSAISKAISLLSVLLTIPLTLAYLGAERFGLWMTVTSLIALMAFADMGLGNGLMSAIAQAHGKDNKEAMRGYISSAFAALSAISATFFVAFFIVAGSVPWDALLNIRTSSGRVELLPALTVFAVIFAVNVPAGIVQRVQMGLQMGFVSNLWQAAGALASFAVLLGVIYYKGGVAWLIFANAGVPVIFLVLNALYFFARVEPDLRPSLRAVNSVDMAQILRLGMLFFVLQLATSLAFASDNLIIGHVLGQNAVAEYSIIAKLFDMILVILVVVITPLWPAYGEALSRGDTGWVSVTLKRSMQYTLVFVGAGCVALVLLGDTVLRAWLGDAALYSIPLFAAFAVWTLIKGAGATYSMFLNGIGIVTSQVILSLAFALSSIVAKVYMTQKFGLIGLLWALIGTYTTFVVLPYLVMTPSILRNRLKPGGAAS